MSRLALLFASLLLLFGSAADARTRKMLEAAEQHPEPGADSALVVFLRASFYGAAIQSSVYEVEDGGQRFLGIVSNKTRIATRVKPGTHRFMVLAENADFLEAELDAGKTYYVLVSPRVGVWKARFSLLPVRSDAAAEHNVHSKEFKEWMEKTRLVEIGPEAEAWYAENQRSIDQKRSEYLLKWNKMLPKDKANLTLRREDGV
jgi:hypothetical protein